MPDMIKPAESPVAEDATSGMSLMQLRLFFLAPLALAFAVILGVWILGLHNHEQNEINREVAQSRDTVSKLYQGGVSHSAHTLGAVMDVLNHDNTLRKALARGDRAGLLQQTAPLFAELRARYGITHLYFSRPDRVNLLRVHQPNRYGDVINRFTTLEAARTGTTIYGQELGPLGTLTLRLVTPWYADDAKQTLIGFVELGMEVDHVMQTVQSFLNIQTFVLISKKFLDRPSWESGMRMLGRTPDWNRFPDMVLSLQTGSSMPIALEGAFAKGLPQDSASTLEADTGETRYRASFTPLQDASGRTVGQMVSMINVSHESDAARKSVREGATTGLAAATALFILFYWLVGRVGRQLERNEQALRDLATHDGLTGLYNHRTFYSLLGDEVARSLRYGTPVSMLMLDLDHFKRVNDQYGHVAGDEVLRQFTALIGRLARSVDSVCRYGGEEIAVILPESAIDDALYVAERMRASVEKHLFELGDDQSLRITVSIGAASLLEQEPSTQQLVAAADQALYAAKTQGRNRVCRYEPVTQEPAS